MWSGSGVMRTAALVQTRQGWVGGGTPATKLPWENKYVTKETGDWMWLNSERGATSKTNNIHVSACWLFTFAHFAVVTKNKPQTVRQVTTLKDLCVCVCLYAYICIINIHTYIYIYIPLTARIGSSRTTQKFRKKWVLKLYEMLYISISIYVYIYT